MSAFRSCRSVLYHLNGRYRVPAQPVDATLALILSVGGSIPLCGASW